MTPDSYFEIVSSIAPIGWLALALSPLAPRYFVAFGGVLVPMVLSVAYVVFVLLYWGQGDGGFGSLAAVMVLFTAPGAALAGWVHFLAFDLFVGGWMVRDSRQQEISHALVLPCLALTFLFGPAGVVIYAALRGASLLIQHRRMN